MINGVTKLIMMKSDVLDTFSTIKACVAYNVNGKETTELPYSLENNVTPIYKEIQGWQTDLTKCTKEEELPQAFKDYINFLEKELETPIVILSVGPDRAQTIVRK